MILRRPLTRAEVVDRFRRNSDNTNKINVRIEVDLGDLIDNDLEGLNDLCDARILEHGFLSDIQYKVCGHTPPYDEGYGSVIIEVTAEVVDDELVTT